MSSEGQSKMLDSEFLSWDESAKKAFVQGFFLADGTIVEGGGKVGNNTTYITLFNTNKDIMYKSILLSSEVDTM